MEALFRALESQGLDKEKGGPKARKPVLIGVGQVVARRLRASLPPRPQSWTPKLRYLGDLYLPAA